MISFKIYMSQTKSIYWQAWSEAGIHHINDILHDTQLRFLSHEELNAEYNIQSTFLNLLQLRSSIPFFGVAYW